ncbi:MAG: quinol:electron acceptor oxidoreductase subunit ActD [Terriglobia bacterium]
MAEEKICTGVFQYMDDVVKACEQLKDEGYKDIHVFSPVPAEEVEELLEEHVDFSWFSLTKIVARARDYLVHRKGYLGRFTLVGAITGILFAWFLAGATAVFYPIHTGGLPILALPVIGLVSFEAMILIAQIFTVMGFIYYGRLLRFNLNVYEKAVTVDRFTVVVGGDDQRLARARAIFEGSGAEACDEQTCRLREIGW